MLDANRAFVYKQTDLRLSCNLEKRRKFWFLHTFLKASLNVLSRGLTLYQRHMMSRFCLTVTSHNNLNLCSWHNAAHKAVLVPCSCLWSLWSTVYNINMICFIAHYFRMAFLKAAVVWCCCHTIIWYKMLLIVNVNMPVPPAQGRALWIVYLRNTFPVARKNNKLGQENLVGGRSDEPQFSQRVWLL